MTNININVTKISISLGNDFISRLKILYVFFQLTPAIGLSNPPLGGGGDFLELDELNALIDGILIVPALSVLMQYTAPPMTSAAPNRPAMMPTIAPASKLPLPPLPGLSVMGIPDGPTPRKKIFTRLTMIIVLNELENIFGA